ncbi:recombinase family protein [Sphaerisporangium aureirubrum]|uniref:Recombinase family protein n=1 Tax=Sphaerisporangium aureirubrum TaxID=1544736 RepID=A0ABW1NDP6_9ACTN
MPPQPAVRELIPAIGYIRVSMLLEEQISPELQRASISEWARRSGRRIVDWIEDLDASGRDFRRKIMRAIEAIEAGKAREIAVWKFSRFGRTRTGNAVNLGRINLAGGELQSATEEVDARTAVGRLTRGVLMEIASFESDRIGEQWAEAHAYRVANGLPANGRPRFGYTLRGRVPDALQPHRTVRKPDDGPERYEIDPITGPVLAQVYRRYINGSGGRELAAWLNHSRYFTARGVPWSDSTILRMLDRGFGAGLLNIHDPNCDCKTRAKCKNMVLIPGAHEGVIAEIEWQAFRRRRLRVAATPPRARASVYPLTLRCGHCKSRMTPTADDRQPGVWYHCSAYLRRRECKARSVRRHVVEAVVLRELAQWADDIERESPVAPAPAAADPRSDRGQLDKQLAALDEALAQLTVKLARGIIPDEAYGRSRDILLLERAEVAEALDKLDVPVPLSRHEYVAVIRNLVDEWTTLPALARRELTADVLPVVEVHRESRTFAWVVLRPAWGGERRAVLPR